MEKQYKKFREIAEQSASKISSLNDVIKKKEKETKDLKEKLGNKSKEIKVQNIQILNTMI